MIKYIIVLMLFVIGCGGGPYYEKARMADKAEMVEMVGVNSNQHKHSRYGTSAYNYGTSETEFIIPLGHSNTRKRAPLYLNPSTSEIYIPIGRGKFYLDPDGNLVKPY